MHTAQAANPAPARLVDLWNREEREEYFTVYLGEPYPPHFMAYAREVTDATKEFGQPFMLTTHLPKWCVGHSEREAARLGFTLGEYCAFILTGGHADILHEGAERLINDLLCDIDDIEQPTAA